MRLHGAARILSSAFLTLSALLTMYGLFGLSRSAWYTGDYFDARLVLFDNGVYPFLWGCFFLLVGQLLRLHSRRAFMGAAAVAGLLLLLWKRATIPLHGPVGQQLFPDAGLLNTLIALCIAMLALALIDRHLQHVIDLLLRRPCRTLLRKLKGQPGK